MGSGAAMAEQLTEVDTTYVGAYDMETVDVTYRTANTTDDPAIAVQANVGLRMNTLTGKILLESGNFDNSIEKDGLIGLSIVGSSTDKQTSLENLTITINSHDSSEPPPVPNGETTAGTAYIYGVTGDRSDTISLTNTDITINAHSNKNGAWIYGLGYERLTLGMKIGIVDADSSITIRDTDPGVARYAGIFANDIEEFHGTVDIESVSETIGASSQGAGIRITGGAGDAILAGTVKVNTVDTATGISLKGGADTISTRIETQAAGTALGIMVNANAGRVNSISSQITATGKLSDLISSHNAGSATGIHIESGTVGSISSQVTASGDGSYVFGVIVYNTKFTDNEASPYVESINGAINVNYGGLGYNNSTAGIASHLGSSLTYADGTVHQTGFGELRGTVTATGERNAVGLELRAGYGIPDAMAGTTPSLNVSGTIYGSISATTTETYILRPGQTDTSGNYIPELNGSRDSIHAKSTVAIRVDEGIETFEQVSNVSELFPDGYPSKNDPNEAQVERATLVFGNGASAVARVGTGYGDAIGFSTQNLALRTENANDRVTLIGDITSVAHGGFIKTGADSVDITTENSPTGELIGDRGLHFERGNYDVSSDYWFVNSVSLGTVMGSEVSKVQLKDSTRMFDTHTMNFHANSTSSYSQLGIAAGEQMTITELGSINVTLGEELMGTEVFRLTLIDGDMIDTMGGKLTVHLHDVLPSGTDGLADDLSSIYVEYDGVRQYYADGPLTFTYTGNATDFVIGRGVIPEPSTATLSVMALAGLLARRRRRKV